MNSRIFGSVLLGISMSSVASSEEFANRTTNSCPYFEVAFTGGWFRTDTANTAYGILRSDTSLPGTFSITPTGRILEIKPKSKFGSGVSINYQSDCWYNLGASYFRYHNKHYNTVVGGTPAAPLISATLIGGLFNLAEPQVSRADSQYDFRYDFGNVELGSKLCVIADCLTLNPKIGLSYARIRNDQTTIYSGATGFFSNITGTDTISLFSRYRGFGPSIGADVDFSFCNGFSVLGNFRSSALVGNLQCDWINSTAGTTTLGGLPAAFFYGNLGAQSKSKVVPLFQMELGLGYTFDLCGNSARILAGYQLTTALNSNRRIDVDNSGGNPGTGIVLNDRMVNSSFQGPFIRLTAKFGM